MKCKAALHLAQLVVILVFSRAEGYVTCVFKGQLCNQMFEIASVLGYAWDHGYEVSFPTLFKAIHGEENYQHVFHRVSVEPFPEGTEFIYYDHDKATDSHVYLSIPDFRNQNVKIDGHCVSEKYFARYREAIRELFAPTEEMVQAIYAKYGDVLKEKTVAVHVRTFIPDNFLTICHTPPHLQWAKWYYYNSAMARFPIDAHFVVFSDDMEWTKKNFPKGFRKVTFVEGNSRYFDLYFISLCQHQIIAPDSTFSWWGAWLNRNPNKMVIAPDQWWGLKQNDSIPEGWIKVKRFPHE
ncbi:MAG: alpha-1,2-fucosyltransferase [Verrucomicrobiota bacterium]|nr:alpha-1,2-fucosyltransferase [Verrucomicrobiota bacterium]